MNTLKREDLVKLMEHQDQYCITIYMPTFRAGEDTQQGRIRLKNMLNDAQTQLVSLGMPRSEANRFVKPLKKLGTDRDFWGHQRDGLAVFLSSKMFCHCSLPIPFEEFLLVGRRFHLKPLLPLFNTDGVFYVLALSQNDVRILRCTRASVKEIILDNIPHSLAEALKYDDPQRQLQLHTNTLESHGTKQAAIFHGQGSDPRNSKDNILRYFRLIDRGLHQILKDEKAPLVIMGVEFLFSIYREANTYPCLTDQGIPGNPEEISAEDIQTLAWPAVEHYFHKAEQEALTYIGPLMGTGRTTHDISEAAPAAYNGQLEILFLADRVHQWGRFDPQSNQAHLHQEHAAGDEDLYDFAAIQTIKNGGSVYFLNPERIPEGRDMTALLRY